jgi:hypothetical protein
MQRWYIEQIGYCYPYPTDAIVRHLRLTEGVSKSAGKKQTM